MNEENKTCPVCLKNLVVAESVRILECMYCGRTIKLTSYCEKGHHVCDECLSADSYKILKIIAGNTKKIDPIEILEEVFSHPAVPMHGLEHHSIVPAVIVAAVRNNGYDIPEGAVGLAIERGKQVPGAYCGTHGACGAALGAGIAVSVLTGADPIKGKERGLSNRVAGQALIETGDGYPRCCKRVSRKSIEVAVKFLAENMNINLPSAPAQQCIYIRENMECALKGCKYFKPAKTIDREVNKA